MIVLMVTWLYCLGDLTEGRWSRSVPSFNGSILSPLAVSRSPKGKSTTTSHVVEREERQRQVTLRRFMGMLAWRLQLVLWIVIPSLQFAGNWRCSLPITLTLRYLRRDI